MPDHALLLQVQHQESTVSIEHGEARESSESDREREASHLWFTASVVIGFKFRHIMPTMNLKPVEECANTIVL